MSFSDILEFGPLSISHHENDGIIFGFLAQLPNLVKLVLFSTIGISLVCAFILSQVFTSFASRKLTVGLSLLVGGIMGNILDRILYGHIVDFFSLSFFSWSTPILNAADVFQWIGYLLISAGVFTEMNSRYPEDDKRNVDWVNKNFQLIFCLSSIGVFLVFSLIFFIFNYTFIKESLVEMNKYSGNKDLIDSYLYAYTISYLSVVAVLSLGVFGLAKIISHRFAGPVFAIRKYIEITRQGKKEHFKLRKQDYLKELEDELNQLNQEHVELKNNQK